MDKEVERISEGELRNRLEQHEIWVKSNGKRGVKADLSRLDLNHQDFSGKTLSGALLCDSNLKRAKFRKTDLIGADLSGSDLSLADLSGAVLAKADLSEATLVNANLRWADLRNARVEGADLRRADMDGAKLIGVDFYSAITKESDVRLKGKGLEKIAEPLPEEENIRTASHNEDEKRMIRVIDKASALTRKIFFPLQLTCVYTILCISSVIKATGHEKMSLIPLPGIEAGIQVGTFCIIFPMVILIVFLYFQLNLVRIWERIALTPDVDGDRVSRREWLDPWLILGLVSFFNKGQSEERKGTHLFQGCIGFFLVWITVPLTLCYVWHQSLNALNWDTTGPQLICLSFSVAISTSFIGLAVSRLSADIRKGLILFLGGVAFLAVFAPLYFISAHVILQ